MISTLSFTNQLQVMTSFNPKMTEPSSLLRVSPSLTTRKSGTFGLLHQSPSLKYLLWTRMSSVLSSIVRMDCLIKNRRNEDFSTERMRLKLKFSPFWKFFSTKSSVHSTYFKYLASFSGVLKSTFTMPLASSSCLPCH